jgi:hypothetical protein
MTMRYVRIALAAMIAALALAAPAQAHGLSPARFEHPRGDSRPTILWFWNGTITNDLIDSQLADMRAEGVREVVIFPDATTTLSPEFFSEGWFDVVGHALRELTGRSLPDEPLPPADPPRIDASRYVGTYASSSVTLEVSQEDDGSVWVDMTPTDDLSKELGEQPQRWELVHYDGDTLITRERDIGLHRLMAFIDADHTDSAGSTGHAAYLHTGRAHARAT